MERALRESDLGIATYVDNEGHLSILLRVGESTFCRQIPAALPLDSAKERGLAAEEASRRSVSIWGLTDFVYFPAHMTKSAASREIGDCTIIAGLRGLAVQVKHRAPESESLPSVEQARTLKRIRTGADQAGGSIRSLCGGSVRMVNARGRSLVVDGRELDWCRVVILDHSDPPELTVAAAAPGQIPLVVLLRRDWDFLFDQLRSTVAVVDYIFRVSGHASHELGEEPARYFELARADAEATETDKPAGWTKAMGGLSVSYPILPTIPAANTDPGGATVYRLILEDVANAPFDGEASDRQQILWTLDRYPAGDRAALGQLLLNHLDDVVNVASGVKWQFRRTVLERGDLQLAFGACTSFNDLHREAFRQWAMLRHDEFTQAFEAIRQGTPRTVAVLLTPRRSSSRLWDTTSFTLTGDIELSETERERIRSLWGSSARGAAEPC
jgi:hypothetical protein